MRTKILGLGILFLLIGVNLYAGNGDLIVEGTLFGNSTSGGTLTLGSTSHTTKGKILFGASAYNEVTNQLLINETTPMNATCNMITNNPASNGWNQLVMDSYGAAGFSYLLGRKSFGTKAAPTHVLNNNTLFSVGATGSKVDGSVLTTRRVMINFDADADWNDTVQPTRISFWTNNANSYKEQMRINKDGNVGIGTTVPGQKLTVAGTVESTTGGFKFPDGTMQTTAASGGSGSGSQTPWASNINAAGYTLFNINQVGIGITAPTANLHIVGPSATRGSNAINAITATGGNGYGAYGDVTNGGGFSFTSGVGGTTFSDSGWPSSGGNGGSFAVTAGNGGGVEEAEGNYVGGGTGGNITLNAGNGGDTVGPAWLGGGTGGNITFQSGFGGTGDSGNGANGYLLLNPTGGNVGIGTTSPNYKLDVAGIINASGGYQQVSDIKFKKDIRSIESPLSKVLNIRGISYNWKTEEYKEMGFTEGRHYGVIGQEIEKVLPEVVKESPDGQKSVSYTEIIPLLIEAIKEQQEIIEGLKTKIQQLETKDFMAKTE